MRPVVISLKYHLKNGLKKNEAYQNKIDWHANRVLAKVNYIVHTDAIKTIIVPILTEKQKNFVYAEEADVINVALLTRTNIIISKTCRNMKVLEKYFQNLTIIRF